MAPKYCLALVIVGGFFAGKLAGMTDQPEQGSRFDPASRQGKMYRERYIVEPYFKALETLKAAAVSAPPTFLLPFPLYRCVLMECWPIDRVGQKRPPPNRDSAPLGTAPQYPNARRRRYTGSEQRRATEAEPRR